VQRSCLVSLTVLLAACGGDPQPGPRQDTGRTAAPAGETSTGRRAAGATAPSRDDREVTDEGAAGAAPRETAIDVAAGVERLIADHPPGPTVTVRLVVTNRLRGHVDVVDLRRQIVLALQASGSMLVLADDEHEDYEREDYDYEAQTAQFLVSADLCDLGGSEVLLLRAGSARTQLLVGLAATPPLEDAAARGIREALRAAADGLPAGAVFRVEDVSNRTRSSLDTVPLGFCVQQALVQAGYEVALDQGLLQEALDELDYSRSGLTPGDVPASSAPLVEYVVRGELREQGADVAFQVHLLDTRAGRPAGSIGQASWPRPSRR
jgi:hypothetical protein